MPSNFRAQSTLRACWSTLSTPPWPRGSPDRSRHSEPASGPNPGLRVLDEDDLIATIGARLLAEPQPLASVASLRPDWEPEVPPTRPPVAAAVLIALVRRQAGLSILYTERSPELRSHSGQIAFPGGKIDPTDQGPADAALREAWEEVQLDRG